MLEKFKLLFAAELAAHLGRPLKTLYSDLVRNPQSLPPRVIIPGSRKLAWLESDVVAWLQSCRATGIAEAAAIPPPGPVGRPRKIVVDQPPKRRPGRPTKAEQLARAMLLRDPQTIDFVNGRADGEVRGAK